MTSREKILAAIKANQPAFTGLPDTGVFLKENDSAELVARYMQNLQTIGGECFLVSSVHEIAQRIKEQFPNARRIVSPVSELSAFAEICTPSAPVASAADIDVVILKAHFGVAENGAVWISEQLMCDRVLPFICQHLVVLLSATEIEADMHQAYKRIANSDYGFALFIAGPSKTADIEQSLVLGAHGPISMTVLITG